MREYPKKCPMCGSDITEYTGTFTDCNTGITTCINCVGKYLRLYYPKKVEDEKEGRVRPTLKKKWRLFWKILAEETFGRKIYSWSDLAIMCGIYFTVFWLVILCVTLIRG